LPEKSRKYFKEYLLTNTDDQLIILYKDLDSTPFRILKEFQSHFKTKNKNTSLKKLKNHSKITEEKGIA